MTFSVHCLLISTWAFAPIPVFLFFDPFNLLHNVPCTYLFCNAQFEIDPVCYKCGSIAFWNAYQFVLVRPPLFFLFLPFSCWMHVWASHSPVWAYYRWISTATLFVAAVVTFVSWLCTCACVYAPVYLHTCMLVSHVTLPDHIIIISILARSRLSLFINSLSLSSHHLLKEIEVG
jgi:hypothetical protein